MAENELEVRLNKKIAALEKQISLLSTYIKRVHGEITHPSILTRIIKQQTVVSAPIAEGVTNGNAHDHFGGDGGQIDHGGLAGLADDDHTQYVKHSLATALSDFLVASGAGAFVKKTLAEVKTILGVTNFRITAQDASAILTLDRNDTTIGTDDIVGRLEVEGHDAGAAGVCAKLEAIAEGNAGETGWRFSAGVAGAVTELMRLTYLGYLGIGVVEPDAQLHVESVTGAVQRLTRKDTSPTATEIIGRIEFETQDSDGAGVGAFIQAEAEGAGGEVGLVFGTGVGGAAAERLRIEADGSVSVISGYLDVVDAAIGTLKVVGDTSQFGIFADPAFGVAIGTISNHTLILYTNNTGALKISPSGVINLVSTPTYATNILALAGGLVAGDVYKTATGELRITY